MLCLLYSIVSLGLHIVLVFHRRLHTTLCGNHLSWLFGCSNKQYMEVSGEVHALAALCLGKVTHYRLPRRLGGPSELMLMLLRKENFFYMLEIRLIPRLSSLKHNHCTVVMSSSHFVGNTN